ncbi:MAG TPA: tRNA (pseudouridine(54)-N(1))-methyltransferase TrmY [Thermoplasmata archaeon]
MRRFIVVGHRAVTTAEFPLNDLAGAAGRMDLLLNAANAALLVSHDLRRDVEVTLLLLGPPDPPRAIRILGERIERWGPDIRGNAALIRRALEHGSRLERETSPGIFASKRSLEEVLAGVPEPLVELREDGHDIRQASLPPDVAFLLSDSVDLTSEEREIISRKNPLACRVGPRSLHTDHVIAIIHNELDRRYASVT